MSYINAIVRDPKTGSISSTPIPEPTLDRAMTWAEQHFDGCELGKNSPTLRSERGSLADGCTIALVRHGGPRPELVVTRQPHLVDILCERGIIDDTTPVISHASRGAVKGKHVLGLLPNYLASLAASITEIPMRLTNEDYLAMHSGKLSIERARLHGSRGLRGHSGGLRTRRAPDLRGSGPALGGVGAADRAVQS